MVTVGLPIGLPCCERSGPRADDVLQRAAELDRHAHPITSCLPCARAAEILSRAADMGGMATEQPKGDELSSQQRRQAISPAETCRSCGSVHHPVSPADADRQNNTGLTHRQAAFPDPHRLARTANPVEQRLLPEEQVRSLHEQQPFWQTPQTASESRTWA